MTSTIQITKKDNVAVAVHPVTAGEQFLLGEAKVTAAQDITQGHKIAIKEIKSGDHIIKYGFAIGHAIEDIQPGSWVHTHNMKTNLSAEESYVYEPNIPVMEPVEPEIFLGFRRRDKSVGIRNESFIGKASQCGSGSGHRARL